MSSVTARPANRNLIAGSAYVGLYGYGTSGQVSGNDFGRLADGSTVNVNAHLLADVDAVFTVGGTSTAEANRFADANYGAVIGLSTASSETVTLLGNTFVDIASAAIDLGNNGIDTNDAGDVDTGPNDLLNHPVITLVNPTGATASVDYQLDVPAGNYRIEFYADDTEPRNPNGYGAGEVLVGTQSITHTGSGVESFSTTVTDLDGFFLAATTTADLGGGDYGSTSEFGPTVCVGDSDGDGLCDRWEELYGDTDGDTLPNENDPDDDGDGTPTASENADPNGDGDPRDALDSDHDGQPDYLDQPTASAAAQVAAEQKIGNGVGG